MGATTLTIKVKGKRVMKLIKELEALNLIQIIKQSGIKRPEKLSVKLAGSLTDEQANKLHDELDQLRAEWERDI